MNDELKDLWQFSVQYLDAQPVIIQRPTLGGQEREWVLPHSIFRFYLFQEPDGTWSVLDQEGAISTSAGHKTKSSAAKACMKKEAEWFLRPIQN